MYIFKRPNIITMLLTSAILAGCAGTAVDFDNDPDLFTQGEEIPNRPGLLEERTGEKLEKTW